jgi:hypothetical protein
MARRLHRFFAVALHVLHVVLLTAREMLIGTLPQAT